LTAATQAELVHIKRNGFRVFRFLDSFVQTILDLYDTAMLFLPALTGNSVPESCALANLQFLEQYCSIAMPARNTTKVSVPASAIHSGDFFGVIRLDGLDPMLAWAMGGSHTGHTTIAMWINNVLHVCESTTKDSYWPTNGIQCTEYTQWLTQAENADYNVVLLPLSPASRAKFNETAALQFIQQNLNLNYGFGNLLWGWVDFESDNYPYPLTWQLHELLPGLLSKISPAIADLLWNQAFNFRLQTQGLNAAELYEQAYSKGLTFGELVSLPEQDNWMYVQQNNGNQTVKGRSMVCDVFVCEAWKAGGLFGSTPFSCSEATNWDIYTLNVFDPSYVIPPQCAAADPDLPFCQLLGKYRLSLPFYNTRSVFPNSFNSCPRGQPPDWSKPVGC